MMSDLSLTVTQVDHGAATNGCPAEPAAPPLLADSIVSVWTRRRSLMSRRENSSEGIEVNPFPMASKMRPLADTSSDEEDEDDDTECSLQDHVAASGALVGENILDSPVAKESKVRDVKVPSSFQGPPTMKNNETTKTKAAASRGHRLPSDRDAVSVGIMAQGLAWVQSQRERRRRLYLQNQAEQQLRILQEAQQAEKAGRTLTENPTFQSLAKAFRNFGDSIGNSATDSQQQRYHDDIIPCRSSFDDNEVAFSTVVSQSGDGYSVNLPGFDEDEDLSWVPPVRVEEEGNLENNPFILTPEQMQQIAVHVLPQGIAYCRWKRLYSLARDGDSFENCLRLIANDSRTLMVVRTSRNDVLGGFADMPWDADQLGYYGGPTSCLFKSTTDGKIRYYKWSGANRYIQLVDVSHKMLAFGGGGDDGAFGLSVEQDFQLGSTGPCDTFHNEPLCDQDTFEIVDMEIFGFMIGQF